MISGIVLNARAAARATITGVERWTAEVLPRLKARNPDRYVLLEPPPGAAGRAALHAWEQLALPAAAARLRASLIFSPANLGPVLWPRNVIVVHDAAVLRDPGAYSLAYRAWHRSVGLACARRALKVVTVSEFSRRELLELLDLDPERVVVVHGGVDSRFQPRTDDAEVPGKLGLSRPYVLTVGTDGLRKNFAALDETAGRLDDEGLELVWAGAPRAHIRAGDAAVPGRRLGYVPDEDLPALYANAAAFVLPSRYEGFGLPCLEAMASGIPVVAADRGALPEVCGDAALLVDPDDRAGLADAVLRAVTEPELRARLVAAGLRRASQYSWDRTAEALHRLLDGLAR